MLDLWPRTKLLSVHFAPCRLREGEIGIYLISDRLPGRSLPLSGTSFNWQISQSQHPPRLIHDKTCQRLHILSEFYDPFDLHCRVWVAD